jgi:murein DD-endopeptidase MepM/ murein hydrolase activator NlpD
VWALRNISPGDWWTRGVAPLAILHAALYLTVQARPGAIAVPLWIWGPPLLVGATIVLLAGALLSARRTQQIWIRRRVAAFAGLAVLVGSMTLYRTFPSEHDHAPSPVLMQLPLDGAITVAWGGASAGVNHHVRFPAERWGFDLVVTEHGRTHRGSGDAVTDYYAYRRPVRAPADGLVVGIHDGEPDATPGEPDRLRRGGNRITLQVAPGQYLFLMHLEAGSIRVTPGQYVRRGEVVARVGNSGNSTEPHLHVHLQDTPTHDWGQGIPFYFTDYVDLPTGARVGRGMPEGGVRDGRYVGDVVRRGG